ncbi:ankyrin repeat domain-containing protein [Candidatus Uabimicrobium amorphum]|uniref:Ankyrin repeat domain-containing protein n=1 Tax=Uabimicrobium amorphum TaxID=2596890 RepID=A0A5S9IQW9_UABAM|nr:ankyrin repeat domain-containing protein [Candidatus Uabimicrobium amorphum]BBM85035.1 hypothetical protein UABAM_03398 [Candidatus Uabimicrobium amorphum]
MRTLCIILALIATSCSFAPRGYENLQNQHDYDNAFVRAVSDGNMDAIEYLLPKVDVNMSVVLEGSPVVIAVKNEDAAVVKRLIAAGADINVPDSAGSYPIHIAVHNNNAEIVQLLIVAKVNLNKKNGEDKTARQIAEEEKNTEMMGLLK